MPANPNPSSRRWLFAWAIGSVMLLTFICASLSYFGGASPEVQLARIRKLSSDPARALLLVRSLIQSTKGTFPEAQVHECQLLLKLGRRSEARNCFAEILQPEACNPDELWQLAEQARTAGELALAGQAYLATGEYAHGSPQRLKLLIYALYSQQSVEDFEDRILKLCDEYALQAPEDAFPWLVSSSLYHERGVPNLAIEAYRNALARQLPPAESYRVRTQLIQLELLLGELPQARQHCNSLLAEKRDSASQKVIAVMHAELLQREGVPAESLPLLDELLAETPGWTQARALRGRCRFDLADLPGAIDDLSEAVGANDFDQQSHYVLGQAYLLQKNQPQARLHLDRSRELNDLMAQIFTLESRLRNDLYNRELKLQLADLSEKHGDHEKAAAWRRGANRSSPSSESKSRTRL